MSTIKIQCAYCGCEIGEKEGNGSEGISHSICEPCYRKEALNLGLRCYLVAYENGSKVAQVDISQFDEEMLRLTIQGHELLGRRWEYKWK